MNGGLYWNAGKGWTPIGGRFAATFDGNGHTISNLFVNAPTSGAGLFAGVGTGGEVRNLGLVDVDVTGGGGYHTGGLAGSIRGAVSFVYVSGGTASASGAGSAGTGGVPLHRRQRHGLLVDSRRQLKR